MRQININFLIISLLVLYCLVACIILPHFLNLKALSKYSKREKRLLTLLLTLEICALTEYLIRRKIFFSFDKNLFIIQVVFNFFQYLIFLLFIFSGEFFFLKLPIFFLMKRNEKIKSALQIFSQWEKYRYENLKKNRKWIVIALFLIGGFKFSLIVIALQL